MPLTPQYLYRGDQNPPIVTPPALLNPYADPPSPTVWTEVPTGAVPNLSTRLTRNAVFGDVTGRYGGGAYAGANGLDLSWVSGLTIRVSDGQSFLDGPVTKENPDDSGYTEVALSDDMERIFIWHTQANALPPVNTSQTPPTSICRCLGAVTTADGAVTAIDYSPRYDFNQGGQLYRRTADAGRPADTPPSTVRFWSRSLNGLWLWDGAEWWQQGESLIRLAAHRLTIPAAGANYRVEASFAGAGTFLDECLTCCCVSDEPQTNEGKGPVISFETNRQTTGRISMVIFVPTGSVPGSYGRALDLELNVAVKGLGWNGAASTGVAATWSNPELLA